MRTIGHEPGTPDREFFAHTVENETDTTKWEPLREHLYKVASAAREFTDSFDSAEWGYLAGLWHDLGKYQSAFQRRLFGGSIRVDHAVIGAIHAHKLNPSAIALAWVIAGHHAGLANLATHSEGGPSPLRERLARCERDYEGCINDIPQRFLECEIPKLPVFLRHSNRTRAKEHRRQAAFWTRMVFSALVDADRLETERFSNRARAEIRQNFDAPATLWERLQRFLESLCGELSESAQRTVVNRARADILARCIASAEDRPGIFSLSAPTGGGKTLSIMAFALRHAAHHELRRVLVVLPFTSIIEQNAAVYRNALGARNVLEHHASISAGKLREHLGDAVTTQHELAEENWDVPIIVTTTVQFFESLHSNRPGTCRKLHNLARSVIILDEVQALPPELLLPILDCLRELIDRYGCTLVLSTATPPALTRREALPLGLPEARPIIEEPAPLFQKLTRVRYHWPSSDAGVVEWESLAERISLHEQVLVIVDRRADAYDLARIVEERTGERSFHLSALMCPAHRLDTISKIKLALQAGDTCRVVSTQLVEAGVDLDFPVVYRALAGLDHIVQAAGRCNREGRHESGDVHIFLSPAQPPPGTLRRGAEVTTTMLRERDGAIDVTDPAVFETYFRKFYGQPTDSKNILREIQDFNFANVARQFKMIDDTNQMRVVCPYSNGQEAIARFRSAEDNGYLNRDHYRALQPYIVQIYAPQLNALVQQGVVLELGSDFYGLAPGFFSRYDETYGLMLAQDTMADPAELIA